MYVSFLPSSIVDQFVLRQLPHSQKHQAVRYSPDTYNFFQFFRVHIYVYIYIIYDITYALYSIFLLSILHSSSGFHRLFKSLWWVKIENNRKLNIWAGFLFVTELNLKLFCEVIQRDIFSKSFNLTYLNKISKSYISA